jgi:hypothetical protein
VNAAVVPTTPHCPRCRARGLYCEYDEIVCLYCGERRFPGKPLPLARDRDDREREGRPKKRRRRRQSA